MGAEVFDRIANRLSDREGEIAVSHGILVVNLAPGAVLAAARALRDVPDPQTPEGTVLVTVAMDREGRHCCLTNSPRGWGYAWMTGEMAAGRTEPSRRITPA